VAEPEPISAGLLRMLRAETRLILEERGREVRVGVGDREMAPAGDPAG